MGCSDRYDDEPRWKGPGYDKRESAVGGGISTPNAEGSIPSSPAPYPVVKLPESGDDFGYFQADGKRYSVDRLVKLTENLPVFDCPLAALDLSGEIWKGCDMRYLAYHCKLVVQAELDYPIILTWNGVIADGRHRVIKALMEGRSTIKAVRMEYAIEPDGTVPEE